MAKKIDNLKKQIQDISKVVNTFKSEAVQLKVVDMLFKNLSNEPETKTTSKAKLAAKPKKKVAAKKQVASKAVAKAEPKAAVKKKAPAKKKAVAKAKPVAKKVASKKKAAVSKTAKKAVVSAETKVAAKAPKKATKVVKAKAKPAAKKVAKKVAKKNPAIKTGASGIIRDMQEKGFFATKRNMNEVVKHFNETLKMPLKITDLSGLVNKLVKENKLKREKNSTTHKYEYVNA